MSEAPDDAKESPLNGDGWVFASTASKASGMHIRKLSKLGERGELERRLEKDSAGRAVYKYNLNEVLLHARALDRAPLDPATQLAKVQSDMTQTAMMHAERSWSLVHGPLLDVITELRTALKDANADNKSLRAELLLGDKQRRELEKDEHERKMAQGIIEREQARKDELVDAVKKAGKWLAPDIKEALGSLGSLGQLAKLKRTLDPSKIRALLDLPGMLTDEEAAVLRDIFADVLAAQPPVGWAAPSSPPGAEGHESSASVDAEGHEATTQEGDA